MIRPEPDTWEARKSAAAHERERLRLAERAAEKAAERLAEFRSIRKQQPWMGEWSRNNRTTMDIFPSTCCVCCGRVLGVCCFIIDPDYVRPPDPVWPFGQDDCPLECGQPQSL